MANFSSPLPGSHPVSSEHADYPAWAVLHLPHDSTVIPDDVRNQFLLSDEGLHQELIFMTDHHTQALFQAKRRSQHYVRAEVSRLVIDVERFIDDAQEPMSQQGMGVVYTRTAHQRPLRRPITEQERLRLLEHYYHPHHQRLTAAVTLTKAQHGQCLVLDCHSFPSVPLPYEPNQDKHRPDICFGSDDFHTPATLLNNLKAAFEQAGLRVAINTPFSGALVPIQDYRKDQGTMGIMVEVNRGLYMNESSGEKRPEFNQVSDLICDCLTAGLASFSEATRSAALQ